MFSIIRDLFDFTDYKNRPDIWREKALKIKDDQAYLKVNANKKQYPNGRYTETTAKILYQIKTFQLPVWTIYSATKLQPIYMYQIMHGNFDLEMNLLFIYHYYIRKARNSEDLFEYISSLNFNSPGQFESMLSDGTLLTVIESTSL